MDPHGPRWAAARRSLDLVVPAAAWLVDLLVWDNDNGLRGGGHAPWWVVPAGSSMIFATLTLRRRRPVAVLAVQLAWATGSSAFLPDYTSMTGVLVALHTVAGRHRPARSLPWLGACAVPLALQCHDQDALLWFTTLVVLMLVAAAAWALGYRTWHADARVARLEKQREAATTHALRAERLRIARELHDIVAHGLSLMLIQAGGARAVLTRDPHRAQEALTVIQDVGAQSMSELRRMLGVLRSESGEDDTAAVGRQPGLADIDALLDHAHAAGLVVSKEIDGPPGHLDPSVGLAAYRLVQEALTNTIKHAGADASVRLHLAWGPDRLAVTVEDRPGRSVPAVSSGRALSTGHGLLGLRERVSAVGGTLRSGPLPTTGFLVSAVLPATPQPPVALAARPVRPRPEGQVS